MSQDIDPMSWGILSCTTKQVFLSLEMIQWCMYILNSWWDFGKGLKWLLKTSKKLKWNVKKEGWFMILDLMFSYSNQFEKLHFDPI